MEHRFIDTLTPGIQIEEVFIVKEKRNGIAKNDSPYIDAVFGDKTGTIPAKIWESSFKDVEDFQAGDFVVVSGMTDSYRDVTQIKVAKIAKAAEGTYDMADFLPTTEKDIPAMYNALLKCADKVQNTYLHMLLDSFFRNEEFADRFREASGAKTLHHAYVGGLLQHTIYVANICDVMAKYHSFINRDLLLTAALLHDIGKMKELSAFPNCDFTDEGNLLGHITIGILMVHEAAAGIPGFPRDVLDELEHCILSHHGEYEFGSPKKPALVEAYVLNKADDLDAHVEAFRKVLKDNIPEGETWSAYTGMLDTRVRRTTVE